MVIGIGVLSMMPSVYGQYDQYWNLNSTATPEQLEFCKKNGINPEQCSESAILAKQRIGFDPPTPTFDGVIVLTMIGSGVALVIGVLAVTKIRKVKKHI
jgi:hypothetical protein